MEPALPAFLLPGNTLTIRLARPVEIEADGQTHRLRTHHQNLDQILAAANITLAPRDELFANNRQIAPPAADAAESLHRLLAQADQPAARPATLRLVVRRAVPVVLQDGANHVEFTSARDTVAQALHEQGISLFPEDVVTPAPETPLAAGMQIVIKRATPVTIQADSRTIRTRTQMQTVGQLLAEQGIPLMGQDFTRPAFDQPLAAGDSVEVVRVRETSEFAEEYITFETQWVPDPDMALDQREIQQKGATGVFKKRTRVHYENGHEVWRKLEDEWMDQEPNNQVIAYGTKITVRTADTPDGPIEYWRKISMRATAYSAATSGKDPDHPRYGITRSGLPAGKGIVAVDPKVIPLMTKLYVEDYGPALAGDTGGRILGKHIDLGFPEDEPLPTIFEWRDVYLLTPVPPADQIRYVLPNWPQK
ncbi:MAG: DUF348 domain-containing protein [Chloroflexi bacterium]|nr:MAG: DUF348 domain-containing protein [Chloroflexota bacterium]